MHAYRGGVPKIRILCVRTKWMPPYHLCEYIAKDVKWDVFDTQVCHQIYLNVHLELCILNGMHLELCIKRKGRRNK
jgi:hypothetical protein